MLLTKNCRIAPCDNASSSSCLFSSLFPHSSLPLLLLRPPLCIDNSVGVFGRGRGEKKSSIWQISEETHGNWESRGFRTIPQHPCNTEYCTNTEWIIMISQFDLLPVLLPSHPERMPSSYSRILDIPQSSSPSSIPYPSLENIKSISHTIFIMCCEEMDSWGLSSSSSSGLGGSGVGGRLRGQSGVGHFFYQS